MDAISRLTEFQCCMLPADMASSPSCDFHFYPGAVLELANMILECCIVTA